MQNLNYRRGSSPVGIIVGLVALALVLGGIWFFVSKPFQTHVTQAYNQATQWTPENIKKDPAGYLTWALAEVSKTEDKLGASELNLRTKNNEANRRLQKLNADKSQYEKLLNDLKSGYPADPEKATWPIRVRGRGFDNPMEFKRAIVECSKNLESTKTLSDTYSKTSKTISDKLDEIEGKKTEVATLKIKLSTEKGNLEANQSIEDIGGIGDQLNSIVDTSSALAKTAESTSVDSMIKPSGDAKVDDEFSKIMGKSK